MAAVSRPDIHHTFCACNLPVLHNVMALRVLTHTFTKPAFQVMTSLETQTHTHPLCSHAANDFELYIIVFSIKVCFQMTASCGWFWSKAGHMINGIIFMVLLGLDQFIQFRVYRRMLKISINAVFYIFSGQQLNATISNCDVSYLYILTFN